MVFDRRGFLKFVAGASAGVMITPLPWKLLDDVSIWTQNWGWIPRLQHGNEAFVNTVSKTCPSAVAMQVRMVGDRAVRTLPHHEHPLGGGLTALAAAEVQMLNSPGRVHTPLLRGPDGGFRQVSWAEAGKLFFDQIEKAKQNVAFISGDETGSSIEVISAFAASLGSDQVYLMPSEAQAAYKAAELMGLNAQFGYDFEQSDYVLAVNANILDTWGTVVRNRRIFANSHPHPANGAYSTATLAYAGPVQNNTAAVAKPWLPIAPQSECAFMLGLCAELMRRGRNFFTSDVSEFNTLAAQYTLEKTAKETGLPTDTIKKVTDDLLRAKAPLVVAASNGQGAAPLILSFILNTLLGVVNTKGGMTLLADAPAVLNGGKTRQEIFKNDLMAFLTGDRLPEVLVIHEANPVYALPSQKQIRESLTKIPFKVAYSTFMDETAMLCDLVLPIPMGLENTDDIYTPYGSGQTIYCLTRPASQPMANVIGMANTLLFLARQMKTPLGFEFYADVLKAKASKVGANFDVLAAGEPWIGTTTLSAGFFQTRPDILTASVRPTEGKGVHLALYSKLNLGTAKTGIPPFNTKTIRAQELIGTTMSVMMNKKTAKANNLADHELVEIAIPGKDAIKARLRVFEGVTPNTVAVCTGFGHSALDTFSQNKGENIMKILDATPEEGTGLATWAKARVTVSKA